MRHLSLGFVISIMASLALGSVQGAKEEVFGAEWEGASYDEWLRRDDAVMTAETSHLLVQSCLRESQEQLDALALPTLQRLVHSLKATFAASESHHQYTTYFRSLAHLLDSILSIPIQRGKNAKLEYQRSCRRSVQEHIENERDNLKPLFAGRMFPTYPPELRNAVHPAPLTWESLREEICTLEGYYSVSRNSDLWKFFSVTRALGSVLPLEEDNKEFLRAVRALPPPVIEDISSLNRYSSVAGKYNGPAVGTNEVELEAAAGRMTGPAMGSRATSLLAFFTTAWREELQQTVLRQTDYPAKAFQLISADKVLDALRETYDETSIEMQNASQTEVGMDLIWSLMPPLSGVPGALLQKYHLRRPPRSRILDVPLVRLRFPRLCVLAPGTFATKPVAGYSGGATSSIFRRTSSLAWLALNAESNVRQNEGLACAGAVCNPSPTTKVLGNPWVFRAIQTELKNARRAYSAVATGESDLPECLLGLENYIAAASEIEWEHLGEVKPETALSLASVHFTPVLVNIGAEVNDKADGAFYLHLATGHGHLTPLSLNQKTYQLWTPSSMLLHLPQPSTTADWLSGLLGKYDPLRL